jgi:hypothetical protein
MAQMFMLDHSSNLLTINNPEVKLLYTPEGKKTYEYLRLDLKRVSNTIPMDITTNVTDLYYQNMSSQDYTLYYERGGGQITTLGDSCGPISTKSIKPQQAEEVRKLVENAKFFDLPSKLLPEGDADYIGYTITVVEEGGMNRNHTVETSLSTTTPTELKALIKYLKTLCREI